MHPLRWLLPLWLMVCGAPGCRLTAPIHSWQPAQVTSPPGARIALTPIAGNRELARRIEESLLAQRPVARADLAMITAEQLAQSSPIRLVSTASLTSDLTAIHAARAAGADILLQGEILAADVELAEEPPADQSTNMNELFFQRREEPELTGASLLLSWRVIDVETAQTLGAQSFTLRSQDAAKQYPDLAIATDDETAMLISASARETWKSLSPYVVKERVRLAVPWLQLGAWRVRRGVAAARRGQWELAEGYWSRAADLFPFSAAAHHNLAVAMAAREDFSGAKRQLQRATGPLAFGLPTETLFWLEQHHRRYQAAHGLGKPSEGWAFPDPSELRPVQSVDPINLDDLPWWTALPLAKPAGWTWQAWLTQPWIW